MKKLFYLAAMCLLAFSCQKYDDTALTSRVDDLEKRVTALEKLQTQMTELQNLVKALEAKDYVTAVQPIMEGGQQIGYAIMFSQSDPVEIYNGVDGKDGSDGADGEKGKDGADGSIVSIKLDTDGIYYWTIDGEFTDPKLRVDGVTPSFKIDEENYWCVSYDNGKTWERLGKSGAEVTSNTKIEYDEDNVYITFVDDDNYKITIPRYKEFALSIARSGGIGIKAGGSVSISYVLTNADAATVVETISENGYVAKVSKTSDSEGVINVTAPTPFVDGKVLVFASKGEKTCMKALYFEDEEFKMSTTTYSVDTYGGLVDLKFNTNVEYKVVIPSEAASWISLVETKSEEYTVTLKVEANTGVSRSALVEIQNAEGTTLQNVTISQDAYAEEYIEALFGFQTYTDETHGFTKDANFTMAVVGDYLILSNSKNIDEMPVYNRYTGELLSDVKVNTEGIDCKTREFRAIATDDAGHLFAVAYTTTLDDDTSNDTVRAFVWKNGIDQKPTSFIWAAFSGSTYTNAPYGVNGVTKCDIYNTVKVYGDLTKDAVIATSSYKNIRPVFQFVKDGKLQSKAYVYWPGDKAVASLGAMTNVIPMAYPNDLTAPTNMEFFYNTGNHNQQIISVTNSKTAFPYDRPTSHWWTYQESVKYQRPCLGIDALKINGTIILAAHNATYAGSSSAAGTFRYSSRLYVSNVGLTSTATSLKDGFIFDSREGDAKGIETAGGPKGTGYTVTGMTSPFSFVEGKTVLADNDNAAFYVLLAPGKDGRSVQVYMLAQNNGLFGYTIPFSKF